MSSILDALRKLEKEKTERGVVLSTAVAGDILRLSPGRRQRHWLLPVVIFVVITLLLAVSLVVLLPPTPELETVVTPLPVAPMPVVIPPPATPMTPVESLSPAAPSVSSLPADLPVLSGIVYQSLRESRMAILNDLPVMEATDIAGYRLLEILPDRVILIRDGRQYVLRLSSARN
jgi:hypothetical protein